MKKILLVCNLGMSTSLLVTNMEKYAKSIDLDVEINAVPITVVEKEMFDWDIIMLGPQVRHVLKKLESVSKGKIPIEIIDMKDYGLMKGDNVVNAALKALES
ncbi:MAG: PTS sugar transporter subunit IIB [Coprobacillaceae bacterium]